MDDRYILKHKRNYIPKRLAYWYDWKTRQIILPDRSVHKTSDELRLVPLMNFMESHVKENYGDVKAVNLYIRAGNHNRYKPDRYWFHIGCDWEQFRFTYDVLQGEYERNGFKVWMYGTGIWFGDEQDILAIHDAYYSLQRGIEDNFKYGDYTLLSTPAITGRDLLEFCLPEGREYPTLPKDLQDLIRRNFGQSRNEHMTPKREVLEDGAYDIDGSFMYASCISHLPVGPYIHDTKNEIELRTTSYGFSIPKYPGIYRVTFTVPDGLNHIGILKAPPRPGRKNDDNYYPNEPGQTFTNWTTGAQLAVAKDHGYPITIHGRIIWPDTERQPDPLAKWRKILVDMREMCDKSGTKRSKLMKVAIRNILLHTIGSFNSAYDYEEIITPRSEIDSTDFSRLAKNKPHRMVKEGYMWSKEIDQPEHKRKFNHPEWPVITWGRCNARITAFILNNIPYDDVIGIRTDCVRSVSKPDSLQEKQSYKPGEFRVKDSIPGPYVWPPTNEDFIQDIIKRNLELAKKGEVVEDDGVADKLLDILS